MIRSVNTTNLTKAYIESKISQELIVSKYLNIPIETVERCINKNVLIKSVFRDDDITGSMGIQYNKKGRLKVRDFGGFGFFEDVYGVVAYVLSIVYERNINTNNKQDFYFVLKHITKTFSNIIDGKEVDEHLDVDIAGAINKGRNRKAIIEIVPRSWNKHDKKIWNKWGVSLNYLNTHFVLPVDEYYINRDSYSKPKYYYTEKDPCYAYYLGENRQGVQLFKLYFPLRNRQCELKFITNCNILEGILNLELTNYDYIIITKSTKDRLAIGNFLSNHPLYGGGRVLNIGIVNLPSENYKLKESEYKWLVNKLNDYGEIISFLDFDTTGRCGAKYLKERFNIPYIFITRGEFNLPNYKCKDFSELCELYGIDKIEQFVKVTLIYIEQVYRQSNEYISTIDADNLSNYSVPY